MYASKVDNKRVETMQPNYAVLPHWGFRNMDRQRILSRCAAAVQEWMDRTSSGDFENLEDSYLLYGEESRS